MYRIISLYLFALLISGCSAFNKNTEISNNTELETISLELTTHMGDQQQFVEGDEIQFLLSLDQDAYIYMYYVDAVSNITQLLPNENRQSNFYTAGYFLTVPDYEKHYRFTISEPFGKESIWVFASDHLLTIKQSPDSIKDIRQHIKTSASKSYGEYELNIVTVPQE